MFGFACRIRLLFQLLFDLIEWGRWWYCKWVTEWLSVCVCVCIQAHSDARYVLKTSIFHFGDGWWGALHLLFNQRHTNMTTLSDEIHFIDVLNRSLSMQWLFYLIRRESPTLCTNQVCIMFRLGAFYSPHGVTMGRYRLSRMRKTSSFNYSLTIFIHRNTYEYGKNEGKSPFNRRKWNSQCEAEIVWAWDDTITVQSIYPPIA